MSKFINPFYLAGYVAESLESILFYIDECFTDGFNDSFNRGRSKEDRIKIR